MTELSDYNLNAPWLISLNVHFKAFLLHLTKKKQINWEDNLIKAGKESLPLFTDGF